MKNKNLMTTPLHKEIGTSNHKITKCSRWFILSAALILLITGLAKIISSFGAAGILNQHDPFFRISFRHLMLLMGFLELTIVYLCFRFPKQQGQQLWSLVWLSICFVTYRLGLSWIGYQEPCHCLGNLADVLGVSNRMADRISQGVIIYLFTGAIAMLLCLWLGTHIAHNKAVN
jgi:hypothetical protein